MKWPARVDLSFRGRTSGKRTGSTAFAMRNSIILGTMLAIVAVIVSSAIAGSTILVPKYTPGTNGLLSGPCSENLAQESHLPVALFQEANTTFDLKLCESVRTAVKPPITVSFLLVTFVFSSPSTNDPVYSFCEMGQPHQLLCTGTNVLRRPGATNEIPLIRVSTVDRHIKDLTADLDVLVGVAPAADPKDARYVRRSFRFVYRNGWREE
jgi:hypothetical protein